MTSENVFHTNNPNLRVSEVQVCFWLSSRALMPAVTLDKSLYSLSHAHNSLGEVDRAPLSVCTNASAISLPLPEGEIHSRLTGICLQTQNTLKMESPLSATTVAWLNLNSRKASRRNISHTKRKKKRKKRKPSARF